MTDEQIETALNACMFGQTKADRCKDCPLDSDKEPCITNLHLAALEYIRRLKHRAEVAERALNNELVQQGICIGVFDVRTWYYQALERAEKELAEERKDD